MKRKIYCTGILILALSTSFAQQQNKKASIEFSLGASIPFGKYASGEASQTQHIQGYAKTGEALNVSYFFPTKQKIGLVLMFAGQRNPLNTKSLEAKYSTTPFGGLYFGSVYPPPTPPTPHYYDNWEFDKKAWYAVSLQAGAYADLPINKDGSVSFTIKAGVGGAYVSSPQYRGISRSDTLVVKVFQSQNDAFGFSYSLVPGLSYQIKESTILTFNVAYFGTAGMSFKDMTTFTTTESGNGMPASMSYSLLTSDVDQPVQSINISVGIRLKF